MFETELHGLPREERLALARTASGETLAALCFDPEPAIVSAVLDNPHASLAFHWEQTGTQVRIDGVCERLSAEESDAYFASRPRGSQLGAWASPQSQPIDDRAVLTRRLAEIEARFEGRPVERPPFWGGYLLVPSRIEFWKDRESRLHERRLFERVSGGWRESMLAP